ncbi:MAG: hypothetical protein ABSC06_29640 [Rhodopila sp.]|jgi:hypothetical protein
MNREGWRLAVIVSPLVLVAACGASGQQRTTGLLDQRMQAQLAPDIAAGSAVLQTLPNGVRVALLDTSLFPNDVKALDDKNPDIRGNIIEALLDPSLMRIQVADTSALPDRQREERVRNVNQYFRAYGLGSTLQPAAPLPATVPGEAAAAPAGLTITISVQCPQPQGGWGYGSGKSRPVCD